MKKICFAAAAELAEKLLLLRGGTGISKGENAKNWRGHKFLKLADQIFHRGAGGDFIFNNPDLSSLLRRQRQRMMRAVRMRFLKGKPGNINAAGGADPLTRNAVSAGFDVHEKRGNNSRLSQADQQHFSCNRQAGGGFMQQFGQPAAAPRQMRAVSRMQLAETRSGERLFSQGIVIPTDKKKSRMVRLGAELTVLRLNKIVTWRRRKLQSVAALSYSVTFWTRHAFTLLRLLKKNIAKIC